MATLATLAALTMCGCEQLWRPFLDPTMGSQNPGCAHNDPACVPGSADLAGSDASPARPTPIWNLDKSPVTDDLYGVYVPASQQAYAVGDVGTLLRFNGPVGSSWSLVSRDTAIKRFTAIHGTSAVDVWISALNGMAYAFDGMAKLTPQMPCSGMACNPNLRAIWTTMRTGQKPAFPWTCGDMGGLFYAPTAGTWAQLFTPGQTSQDLNAIWGTNSDDVWIGGTNNALVHYDGKAFDKYSVPTSQAITGIWGIKSDYVWAVGTGGVVMSWDAANLRWQQWVVPGVTTKDNLRAVTCNARGEVWAVGDNGLIVYYDGATWYRQHADVTANLYGISVLSSESTPQAVGAGGTILRLSYLP